MSAAAAPGAPATACDTPVAPIARIDVRRYDRTPTLHDPEREALAYVVGQRVGRAHRGHWPAQAHRALARLLTPIADVLDALGVAGVQRYQTAALLQAAMHERQAAYWAWTREDWLAVFAAHARHTDCRQQVLACMYLLGGVADVRVPGVVCHLPRFAAALLGADAVAASADRVRSELRRWGWTEHGATQVLHRAVSVILLASRSPHLEAVTPPIVQAVLAATPVGPAAAQLRLVARALVGLGLLRALPATETGAEAWSGRSERLAGVPTEWAGWCRRWYDTSTLGASTRRSAYYILLKAGRWLAATHPEAATPAAWTRDLAATYVAAVDRLTHGAWVQVPEASRFVARQGQPLSAHAKLHHLTVMRAFFRDGQEWGWFSRRFDPGRAFVPPRALRAAAGPAPRVIADDIWAKLLWAGLTLGAADLPVVPRAGVPWYPLELTRALVVAWLFTGLRWDELRRLRVGCIRWQRGDVAVAGTVATLPKDAVCWLDVPVNKTMAAFTKPVDRVVGEAIAAWEAARPTQPALVDPKTGEAVDYLFLHRGRRLGPAYLNKTLIPLVCRRAGIPRRDARGSLSSHRARSTIASQLANARDPLTLLELMAWLGHRSPATTQHYVAVAPTRLARAYADADYFRRNIRRVEVLIDREAVTSGAAATGEPWRFYDLGHGYCTYDFFDQCPHRMACAKCAFYRPKGSTAAQLLEGRANLLRFQQELPLTEEERAAVEDGLAAHARLLAQLTDVPTPAGPTPQQLRGDQDGAGQAIDGRAAPFQPGFADGGDLHRQTQGPFGSAGRTTLPLFPQRLPST